MRKDKRMDWKKWKVEEPREIEVRDDKGCEWKKRVIHHSHPSGECMCFNGADGYPGDSWDQWREIPKKVIKPFESLPSEWAGKAVRGKSWGKGGWTTVVGCFGVISQEVVLANNLSSPIVLSLDEFAKNWETVDGEPCGIEVEE